MFSSRNSPFPLLLEKLSEKHLKLMMYVVYSLEKHPLQIGGKVRNDLYCIDQFIRVVFRQIVLMELHFLLFS